METGLKDRLLSGLSRVLWAVVPCLLIWVGWNYGLHSIWPGAVPKMNYLQPVCIYLLLRGVGLSLGTKTLKKK